MYEYAPVFAKKKEKLLTYGFLILGMAIYLMGALIPGLPMPGLFQVVGVFCLVVMIMLFSLCLSKRYVYSIGENERGGTDFTITEYYGRRITVVCRVSVDSVKAAIPVNGETRKSFSSQKAGNRGYNYTGVLFDEKRWFLKIEESGEAFLVQICANDDLIRLLTSH